MPYEIMFPLTDILSQAHPLYQHFVDLYNVDNQLWESMVKAYRWKRAMVRCKGVSLYSHMMWDAKDIYQVANIYSKFAKYRELDIKSIEEVAHTQIIHVYTLLLFYLNGLNGIGL
jgi:hypothetical protein